MKITAAVVREPKGAFTIEEVDLEEPRSHEVLVKIVGTGVCHTDLFCRSVFPPVMFPFVFGHEGAGIVEKVGSAVTKVKPGDHVVLSFASCGQCRSCMRGDPAYCVQFSRYNTSGGRPDGSTTMKKGDEAVRGAFFGQSSFASHSLANEQYVVKVDQDAPLELLGPLGCGFQTGAGGVINSLRCSAGSSIAVFGIGSVGLSAIMGAVVCGCTTIIGVDLMTERLQVAEELGATHIINAKEDDPVKLIQDITGGGIDFTLECTGNPTVFRQAVDALHTTGECGLIGLPIPNTEVSLNMSGIQAGRRIRGVLEGDAVPDLFIPKMVALYRQGRFPIDKLTRFYDLRDINQAVEDSEKGLVVKAVVRP